MAFATGSQAPAWEPDVLEALASASGSAGGSLRCSAFPGGSLGTRFVRSCLSRHSAENLNPHASKRKVFMQKGDGAYGLLPG